MQLIHLKPCATRTACLKNPTRDWPSGNEDVHEAGDGVDGVKEDVEAFGEVGLHQAGLDDDCNNEKSG